MLRVDTTTTGSVADSDFKRSIVESIKYNRRFMLGFNQAEWQISTESGIQKYPLPRDFIGLTSPIYWSQNTSDDGQFSGRRELVWRPMPWIDANLYRVPGTSEYLNLGDSRAYGLDMKDRTLALSPVPGTSDSRLDFSYHKDPGTPGYSYSSGTWTFTVPFSEDAITDAFTNEWFDQGYYLILNRAAFIMWSRIEGGTEESVQFQGDALRLWAEELNRLRSENARFTSGTEIRRRM
jgi:hypothetical protein